MSRTPTKEQLQRTTGQVFALLSTNGSFPRWVFDMSNKKLPTGPGIAYKLIKQHRFDAVRCEILGVTLTVEISTERSGLQPQENENNLRYCTASYELFRRWFFKMLTDAGVTPKHPEPVNSIEKLRAGLKKPPYINHNRKR